MSTKIRIDLVSDTATKPTPEMRQAMAEAEVGDEQRGEDPTVNLLCVKVCELVGKEAALFLPSGTMCNQIAFAVHCRPGDEILGARNYHINSSEGAGVAVIAGALINPLEAPTGIFLGDDIKESVHPERDRSPRSRVVVIEQTTTRGGGRIWPLEAIKSVAEAAKTHGLVMHMDGARLMNAVVASGVSARSYAEPFDSVWIDLSKSLGCPVGAVLAGSAEFIKSAWVWKHRLGGAMRQAGILAAAGIYALDHHVNRLSKDHENAKLLAEKLSKVRVLKLDSLKLDTNIVFFDIEESGRTADELSDAMLKKGIRIGAVGETRLRAVTHLDIDQDQVIAAAEEIANWFV